MTADDLTLIATADLAGHVRGRAVTAGRLASRPDAGVGWVPANLAITAFGELADSQVSGPTGDLRLLPDPTASVELDHIADGRSFQIVLADLVNLDHSPWECCPRHLLRRVLVSLEAEFGVTVRASFEHEFTVLGADGAMLPRGGAPFSIQALRWLEPFGSHLVGALEKAGFEPDNWLPEFGPNQFEITLAPADALVAADRAVLLRELVRDLASQHGRRASFAPLIQPTAIGNGVHVHFSLQDGRGEPVLYDPTAPGGLSPAGGAFAAGVLRHAAAVCALTAPSVVSYLRMRPHTWSSAHASLGLRNRESMLRICPTVGTADVGGQYNLEFRAADATANPWLVMAAIMLAGLEGLRAGLKPPEVLEEDPGAWPDERCMAAGIVPMPGSLDEALAALAADEVVCGWLGPELLGVYLAVKRNEIASLREASPQAICERYAGVY